YIYDELNRLETAYSPELYGDTSYFYDSLNILKKGILHDDIEIITNLLNYSKYPKRKSYIDTFDPFLLCTKEEFINSWDAYYYSVFENEKYRAPTSTHTISKTKTVKYSHRKVELFFGKLFLNHLLKNAIKMNIDTINILLTEEVNEYILKFSIMYFR
ncbi:MAG: hypothetical protein JXJ04_19520, partial [Spirochaetales bacterium]|nr:hypothetical protein [Spirochaetales bacterium]